MQDKRSDELSGIGRQPEAMDKRRPFNDPVTIVSKITAVERQRHFDDRAVVGGLAHFLEGMLPRLALEPDLWERLRGYHSLGPTARSAAIEELERALNQTLSDVESTPSPQPAPKRREGPSATPSVKDKLAPSSPAGTRTGEGGTPKSPIPVLRVLAATRTAISPDTPLSALSSVGPARAKRLLALGLETAGDLRLHLPHRYVSYPPAQRATELGFQNLASFEGTITNITETPLPGSRRRISATLKDETGSVTAVWIRGGRWPMGLRQGMRLAISGQLVRYGRQISFENPDYEPADEPPLHTRRSVPVYPLTAGLPQVFLRTLIHETLQRLTPKPDPLPDKVRYQEGLIGREEALQTIHAPTSEADLATARQRIAFDEMLPIELLVLQRRQRHQSVAAPALEMPWPLLAEFRRQLPFALTGGQQRVISAIFEDLARDRAMCRLLQGDVGSGKTVVAAMVLLAAAANGAQGALVAPTEILAEQHLRTLTDLYARVEPTAEQALGQPLRLALLTGSVGQRARKESLAAIAEGQIDVVVGTHAVFESDVAFRRLGVAIVDEQHRFGVRQRVALRQKGQNPHLLVMTATPIPRTLALTLYGDLDLSLIEELPPGRQPVETILLASGAQRRAYDHIRQEVSNGHQAFVICPLVEESPAVEARAATAEYARLREGELAGLRLALLHGRMRSAQKDETMRAFAAGEFNVLVSTPVVEVGVDVPNATVMLIEGAERFGLAQLHQFRGRIGRGADPACCFLVASSEASDSLARLEAVARSSRGLDLAEEDLRTRGPGEYFGLKQSGFPALQVADITDLDFVERVREAAARLLEGDPGLAKSEHRMLAAAVQQIEDRVAEAN